MSLFLELAHPWENMELEHFARCSMRTLKKMVATSMRQDIEELSFRLQLTFREWLRRHLNARWIGMGLSLNGTVGDQFNE